MSRQEQEQEQEYLVSYYNEKTGSKGTLIVSAHTLRSARHASKMAVRKHLKHDYYAINRVELVEK